MSYDDGSSLSNVIAPDSENWTWTSIPLTPSAEGATLAAGFVPIEGSVDLDTMLYSDGEIPAIAPGSSFTMPAPVFFHGGCTDLDTGCVRLRPAYEPDTAVFYGPCLPLRTEGDCEISLDFDCGAAPGTLLGELSVGEVGGRDNVGSVPVLAGRKAAVQWVAEAGSLPLRAAFRYSRNAEVRIRNVVIRRRQ